MSHTQNHQMFTIIPNLVAMRGNEEHRRDNLTPLVSLKSLYIKGTDLLSHLTQECSTLTHLAWSNVQTCNCSLSLFTFDIYRLLHFVDDRDGRIWLSHVLVFHDFISLLLHIATQKVESILFRVLLFVCIPSFMPYFEQMLCIHENTIPHLSSCLVWYS